MKKEAECKMDEEEESRTVKKEAECKEGGRGVRQDSEEGRIVKEAESKGGRE